MLKGYNRILAEVRSMGGEIVGLTSESQGRAESAGKEWGIDFPLLSDPSCQLVTFMNDNGWIASTIERSADITESGGMMETAIGGSYKFGMLQPGVLALRGAITTDGGARSTGAPPEILLSWGSVPTADNVNGAMGRLHQKDAMAALQLSLSGDLSLAYPAVVQGKTTRSHQAPPRPLLYALLIANGNFLYPKPLVLDPDGTGDIKSRLKTAVMKLAIAVGAVGVGFFTVPRATAVGLVAYAVFAVRAGGPLHYINTYWKPQGKPDASKL